MAHSIVSRFRPTTDPATASIYETIREHDREPSDLDDEPDTDTTYHHDPPRYPSSRTRASNAYPLSSQAQMAGPGRSGGRQKSSAQRGVNGLESDDVEDDVPASLLIEDLHRGRNKRLSLSPPAVQGTSTHWQSPSPVRLHHDEESLPLYAPATTSFPTSTTAIATSKEKAMWRWANVRNLDNFLADVYEYYTSRGYWSIVLKRTLNLLNLIFVIGFCLFLTQCVDYTKIKGSTKLEEILVKRCTARMGFLPNLVLWVTAFVCIIRSFQYLLDLRRLNHLHDFYHHLLNVPESEIQSISWQEVVRRLMALRDSNPNIKTSSTTRAKNFMGTQSKQRMDAHDIANRLMRKDNYMIAMINKEVIDTTLALPFLGSRQFFTKTLEWHLNYCVMDYVFNPQGQIRQLFLKDTHRKALSEGLQRRFIFAGFMSLLFAPFLISYNVVGNFFQRFNEYQKEPAQLGFRQYNNYAHWKFREFNELWHLFERRLKMSHPFATRYVNQFPKDKTVQLARFVALISGAIISVLGLATILDQESFLSFEITNGRTTIFYLGVFGSVWAVARGMLPDDNMIYDSSYSMEEVIEFTHYKPAHWNERLHTVDVKSEFEQLYQMHILVLLEELLSMVFTPFVLWFSLPRCSDRIIDFFREFTVNVDGLGYVCSFAEFNFKKTAQTGSGANAGTRAVNPATRASQAREQEYYATKDDKLEQSYYNFLNDYSKNPKTDIRFSYTGRHKAKQFHAPPPFPGPLSPLPQQDRNTQEQDPSMSIYPPASLTNARKPNQRRDLFSPQQSVLLDPHHQPPIGKSAFVSPPSLRTRRTELASRILPTSRETMMSTALKEEDEDTVTDGDGGKQVSTSHAVQSASDLGSWKDEDELVDEDEGDMDPQALVDGRGVIGLIKQFQRAQDDDKRGNAVV
ncbi:autophagy protein atg9 [Lithohypha guttulata]|uniref:Autophagy-related protein 9 n=1 Tax=Lithohypha guttulata TaxID=1690604 RepID=A0AAN7SVR0_9EURO|nr:autophagy protein atg9 [Lithohypha guttulata]